MNRRHIDEITTMQECYNNFLSEIDIELADQ